MHRLRPQRSAGVPWHLHPSADERCEGADVKDALARKDGEILLELGLRVKRQAEILLAQSARNLER
jgi:hypothetical protein